MDIEDVLIPSHISEEWDQSIARGMKFLDTYFVRKDWVDEIDLEGLDLNDSTRCVCGQIFATHAESEEAYGFGIKTGYEWALKFVMEHDLEEDDDPYDRERREGQWSEEHGFYAPLTGDFTDDDEFDGYDPEEEIYKLNGFDTYGQWRETGFDYWGLFTERWKSSLKKRKEHL